MGRILSYFREVRAQKQIDKLVQKYKDKKIVIYGAGTYFQILNENYDLSKLNIIAICDKKFESSKESNPSNYTAIAPIELKSYEYDIILTALYDDVSLCDYLECELLLGTPNENKQVRSLIEPTLVYTLKILLGR